MTSAMTGGCDCGSVRYELRDTPMVVNCCHCSWCQRETGSAFAINAVIERDRLAVTGVTEPAEIPSASGKGQQIHRCPACHVALWSHYASAGPKAAFVRAGTLDDPAAVSPDAHIYTDTKLPWVQIPADAKAYEGFYKPRELWSPDTQARWGAMMAG